MERLPVILSLVVFAAAASAEPGPAESAPPSDTPRTVETSNGTQSGHDISVTLVTGDRVVVADGDFDRARVEPAAGRKDVSFHISSAGDRLEVVPSDASRHLANRTLDDRLFDVSLLIESGYDDANTDTVPLIVSAPASADAALAGTGAAMGRELAAIDGSAAEVDKARAAEFWSAMTAGGSGPLRGVERVWLDATGHTTLDESTALVNAPTVWDAGVTGEGVTIAILDSGIDASHPDLAGRVAAAANFTGEEVGDLSGHGTLVASAAAGTGAASDGTYRGLAPDATLLDGKVTNAEGTFRESAVIDGMQWAADQGAQVVNLSLGATVRADRIPHPFEQAADRLTEQAGLLFVAAAGNAGSADGTVESPASAESALGVGAVDKDGAIWEQSSPGPRAGATAVKPDILAPGVDVTGARASDGYIGVPVDDNYVRDSGTSLSAPLVAGAAALLLEAEPDLAPDKLKARLMASADPRAGEPAYEQGAGLLNVATAVEQTVTTEPTNVDFGVRRWPHPDDEPVGRTVTYVNTGAEDVALELSVVAYGPGGEAPAGEMFTLAESALTVPASGTAETTLTADTSLGGPNGHYSGHVTAVSPDGSTTTTPFGVHQEAELYDVSFAFTGRNGEPSESYSMRLQDHDEEQQWWFAGASHGAAATVRIPPGRYHLDARFPTPDGGLALLVQPLLDVTEDTAVEVDARSAKAVEVAVPDDSAELERGVIGYQLQLDEDARRFSSNLVGLDRNHIGHLGPELDAHQFESRVVGFWGTDSDDRYALAWFEGGRLPTGLRRDVHRYELATLRLHAFSSGTDQTGSGEIVTTGPFLGTKTSGRLPQVDLPAALDLHVTTGDETWQIEFEQQPNLRTLRTVPTSYEPGRWRVDSWNAAVIGPGLVSPDGSTAATRQGDTIQVDVPLQTDRAGHPGSTFLIDYLGTRTALYADGALVNETNRPGTGQFDVPPGAKDLRLRTTLARLPGTAHLSTTVDVAWTFRTRHVSGTEPRPLPLSVVRFMPYLDRHNRMPARPTAFVPVTVEAQPGTPPVDELVVEASSDDGETWAEVPVTSLGHGWLARVRHDPGAQFVSLRATATDEGGNTVEQTIIRAYELAER